VIEDIFLTKAVATDGKYELQLFINGARKTVVIDDYLPWDPANECLAFCHSSQKGEIWMSLLEKAWAKVHGDYGKVIEGK
jgi:hypothetical protein